MNNHLYITIQKYKNYIKQSIWSVLEYIAYPLMMLATIPLYLKYLGVEQYGLWVFLYTLIGFGSLVNGGVAAGTIKEISAANLDNVNKIDRIIQEIVSNSLMLIIIINFIFLIPLGLFGWFYSPYFFSKIGNTELIRFILLIAIYLIILEQIDGVYTATLRGIERYDVAAKLEIIMKLSIVITSLITAISTNDFYKTSIALLIASTTKSIIKIIFISSLLKIKLFSLKLDKKIAGKIFNFSKWSWMQTTGGFFLTVGDRLLIGALLGSTALSYYSIALQLTQQIHALPSAAMAFFFPMISRKKSEKNLKGVSCKIIKINIFLTTLLSISFFFGGVYLIEIWINHTLSSDFLHMFNLMILAFSLLSINIAPHYILYGLGQSKGVAALNIVGGILYILICYQLIIYEGLAGAAEAKIIFGIVTLLNYPLLNRALNMRILNWR